MKVYIKIIIVLFDMLAALSVPQSGPSLVAPNHSATYLQVFGVNCYKRHFMGVVT